MSLHEIINVRQVLPQLLTGGQPTEAELAAVASEGYAHVVNLGLLDPAYCLADEAGLARQLGMSYRHIPVDFQHPRLDELQAFAEELAAHSGERLFVHCAMNYRASAFTALVLEKDFGWARAEADELIHDVWEPYGAWPEFVATARKEWIGR
ncbi:protein tyrosine phosphatase family protein [Acidihalobacter prosperus]